MDLVIGDGEVGVQKVALQPKRDAWCDLPVQPSARDASEGESMAWYVAAPPVAIQVANACESFHERGLPAKGPGVLRSA